MNKRVGLVLGLVVAAAGVAGCADDGEGVSAETGDALNRSSADVEIVVEASQSEAARLFLFQFVQKFTRIVDIDRRDGSIGVSSNEEYRAGIYRARRNDGTIQCERFAKCTFTLKKVAIVNGNPVSKGDRNSWGGQLFSTFVSHTGDLLGSATREDSVVIGAADAIPRIECERAGTERGLETNTCTFKLAEASAPAADDGADTAADDDEGADVGEDDEVDAEAGDDQ